MRILVVGDVHGELGIGRLNTLINKKQPDLILQCGDLGFWPKSPLGQLSTIKLQGARLHFCDGNHEDHAARQELVAKQGDKSPVELEKGIFFQPRVSTLTLPDGRVVCFFGGAKSVDWQLREQGKDWFPEEILTHDDLWDLPETADIVISHTIPTRFRPEFGVDKQDDLVPEGGIFRAIRQRMSSTSSWAAWSPRCGTRLISIGLLKARPMVAGGPCSATSPPATRPGSGCRRPSR